MKSTSAFWDTSALVPLLVTEPSSLVLQAIAKDSQRLAVWWSTAVEASSAIARQVRHGQRNRQEADFLLQRLHTLLAGADEVVPSDDVRADALSLLQRHPLHAADALQLAAALAWTDRRPRGQAFVCLDARLRHAAWREGFVVLPEDVAVSG